MIKKVATILLLCLCIMTVMASIIPREDEFAGGSGTKEDPYLVETAEHLSNVRNYPDAYFLQIDDINLFVEPWNTGSGWAPIRGFTGVYDGNNYDIRNMMIKAPEGEGLGSIYWGLFGDTENAILRNIHLKHIDLRAEEHIDELYDNVIGALAGKASGGFIYNCSAAGGISSESNHAGGLVGINSSDMFRVFTEVNVTGENRVGGLIGYSTGTRESIIHAYSRGSVSGGENGNEVGGLVGRFNAGYITDSYSRGNVSGNDHVGGFAGTLGAFTNFNMINRCYSTGSVEGTGDHVGGFSGSRTATTTVLNCFWDTERSGMTHSAAGIGLSTEEMQQEASYKDYNFLVRWSIDEGNNYPVFQDFDLYQQPQPVELSEMDGSGTPEEPYIITTLDELNAMRQDKTASYVLANDIDMAATLLWNHGRGWMPLGEQLSPFTGTLDGNDYTLHNMVINRTYDSYQGLFGSCQGAQIRNLYLENVDLTGSQFTGSVTGSATSSSVFENISATGVVIALFSDSGGIVGRSTGSIFHHVAADVNVYGANQTAGFVGNASRGEFRYSYSLGNVYGTNYVGGFAGQLNNRSTTHILDCYSRGHVYSDGHVAYAGGFVGSVEASRDIKRCFSTGTVTITNEQGTKGGFAGRNHSNRILENCYWDMTSSQEATSHGAEGRTTEQMTYPYDEDTYVDWDFDEVWIADESGSVNDGYPYLPWPAQEADILITVIADPTEAGTVEGGGNYMQGQQVAIAAEAHEGYIFINWTEDGNEVSASEEYSFEATENRTLTAHFPALEDLPEYDAKIVDWSLPVRIAGGTATNMLLTLRNTGHQQWLISEMVYLGAVGDQDYFASPEDLRIAVSDDTNSGDTNTFEVPFRAPNETGWHTTEWQMLKEGEFWFGETFSQEIEVFQRTDIDNLLWQLYK